MLGAPLLGFAGTQGFVGPSAIIHRLAVQDVLFQDSQHSMDEDKLVELRLKGSVCPIGFFSGPALSPQPLRLSRARNLGSNRGALQSWSTSYIAMAMMRMKMMMIETMTITITILDILIISAVMSMIVRIILTSRRNNGNSINIATCSTLVTTCSQSPARNPETLGLRTQP